MPFQTCFRGIKILQFLNAWIFHFIACSWPSIKKNKYALSKAVYEETGYPLHYGWWESVSLVCFITQTMSESVTRMICCTFYEDVGEITTWQILGITNYWQFSVICKIEANTGEVDLTWIYLIIIFFSDRNFIGLHTIKKRRIFTTNIL